MKRFTVNLDDETGCPFTIVVDAADRDEAWDRVEEDYPESRITAVRTQEEIEQEEKDRYDRLSDEYDNGW